MNDIKFYEEIEKSATASWDNYEKTYKKITAHSFFSNTALPGITELHKLIEDTNISFNMVFDLLKIRPSFDEETQEAVFNSLEALADVSSQMNAIFEVAVQSGDRDTAYTLQDYIY